MTTCRCQVTPPPPLSKWFLTWHTPLNTWRERCACSWWATVSLPPPPSLSPWFLTIISSYISILISVQEKINLKIYIQQFFTFIHVFQKQNKISMFTNFMNTFLINILFFLLVNERQFALQLITLNNRTKLSTKVKIIHSCKKV